MSTLVAYATRYGATRGIAERIADTLVAHGQPAEAHPVSAVSDVGHYDAFVIGSAVYMFHWRKEALRFVKRNRAVLAGRPVWLFSSGPLGTDTTDAAGRDVHDTAGPKELDDIKAATSAREHHVFFGAVDLKHLRGIDRAVTKIPAMRKLFIEGDFRDWQEIDAWAASIARELATTSGSEGAPADAGASVHEAA
jgi:menaquinone-dependent protoporphyrinogen oxidase